VGRLGIWWLPTAALQLLDVKQTLKALFAPNATVTMCPWQQRPSARHSCPFIVAHKELCCAVLVAGMTWAERSAAAASSRHLSTLLPTPSAAGPLALLPQQAAAGWHHLPPSSRYAAFTFVGRSDHHSSPLQWAQVL
jgi:hypothetical protein